ncbi:L,D-transpeptidase family protein [Phenylobacterium sp. LjRoot225]|uniref:L,D-transpeptidase family protein n=1 Tax=Phenylobacterium sp. LjRoot225 TaxID=3342285 RepID=UPI003ECDB76C
MGLIALAGGLAAPVSMPVAGPLTSAAAALRPGPVGEILASRLATPAADAELAAFYAARGDRPLWTARGRLGPEADQLVALLRAAADDGLDPQAYRPDRLQATVRRAASGRPADLARAEIELSGALAAWGADLHRPNPAADLLYSDPQLRPPVLGRRAVLEMVARAPSLQAGLAQVSQMNPIYQRLRSALAVERAQGGPRTALIRANLERARALPTDLGRRYILVDVAAQRLWTYEAGRPTDSMKVVVGKPTDPTPAMAALVRYAVFRPYWNVPPDMVAKSMAPKVVAEGLGYFRGQRLEALSDWTDRATRLNPAKVNWPEVAAGRQQLRVRQLPGRANMMGQVKFMFPNELGVYLHDSPLRALFTGEERLASAGCVRLEDAPRLARWLLGEAVTAAGRRPGPPETRADLTEPVPVYLVYFTVAPTGEGLNPRRDIYRRDPALIAQLEAGSTRLASR